MPAAVDSHCVLVQSAYLKGCAADSPSVDSTVRAAQWHHVHTEDPHLPIHLQYDWGRQTLYFAHTALVAKIAKLLVLTGHIDQLNPLQRQKICLGTLMTQHLHGADQYKTHVDCTDCCRMNHPSLALPVGCTYLLLFDREQLAADDWNAHVQTAEQQHDTIVGLVLLLQPLQLLDLRTYQASDLDMSHTRRFVHSMLVQVAVLPYMEHSHMELPQLLEEAVAGNVFEHLPRLEEVAVVEQFLTTEVAVQFAIPAVLCLQMTPLKAVEGHMSWMEYLEFVVVDNSASVLKLLGFVSMSNRDLRLC